MTKSNWFNTLPEGSRQQLLYVIDTNLFKGRGAFMLPYNYQNFIKPKCEVLTPNMSNMGITFQAFPETYLLLFFNKFEEILNVTIKEFEKVNHSSGITFTNGRGKSEKMESSLFPRFMMPEVLKQLHKHIDKLRFILLQRDEFISSCTKFHYGK